MDLYVGQTLNAERLSFELNRLGYLAVNGNPQPARAPTVVAASVSRFTCEPSGSPMKCRPHVQLQGSPLAPDPLVELHGIGGVDLPVYRLDPLLIGSIFPVHGEDRIVVSPGQVPPMLPEALKAVEDRRFDQHHGVNPTAILRAAFANVRAGQVEQGGSTLTQQLVRIISSTAGARCAARSRKR